MSKIDDIIDFVCDTEEKKKEFDNLLWSHLLKSALQEAWWREYYGVFPKITYTKEKPCRKLIKSLM